MIKNLDGEITIFKEICMSIKTFYLKHPHFSDFGMVIFSAILNGKHFLVSSNKRKVLNCLVSLAILY